MHFINISDLAARDWRFLEPLSQNEVLSWSFHYGRPKNLLERFVRRPALGRYRAALSAAKEARQTPEAILISHLPRVSAAVNIARRQLCPSNPHIAFAFNFTDLPQGRDRARLARWLRDVDACVVFSRYEQRIYPDWFDLPADKFHYMPWTMEPPKVGDENRAGHQKPYLCSIGGEGRDYALLAQAMTALPDQQMVIVARPYSVAGISFPDNVTVFTNLPGPDTWRIAKDSLGLVIPLKSNRTACGHITIVGSQLLGLPLLLTRSLGVEDYVINEQTGLLMGADDKDALINGLRHLYQNRSAADALGNRALEKANTENNPRIWLDYFERFKPD